MGANQTNKDGGKKASGSCKRERLNTGRAAAACFNHLALN